MKRIHRRWPVVLQAAIYIVSWTIFKIFCRFTVYGLDRVRNLKHPVIFAANHSSEWDGILIRAALPFFSRQFSPMYYVSMVKQDYVKSGWRQVLYGGKLFELLGAYPRYSGRKDYAYSLQNHVAIIKQGGSPCIFPEGKRTEDGSIGQAHGGVSFLSHETHTPVVPVAVSGLVRLSLKDFLLRKRTVVIHFGNPKTPHQIVPQSHPSVVSYKEGAQLILNEIEKMLHLTKAMIAHRDPRIIRISYFFVRKILGFFIKKIWVRKVTGLSHIPRDGAAIVALNHQSYFDFLCFVAVSPRNVHFLAAEKFFKSLLWKPLMLVTGQIRVDRFEKDKRISHASVFHHLHAGKLVGIFPEGTRNDDPTAMKFAYPGVAKFALRSHVPVIPVGVRGTYDILSRKDPLPKFRKIVEIHIGKPLFFPEFLEHKPNQKAYRVITDEIMNKISTLSEKPYPHKGKIRP